jgi:hypothetical protein
MTLAKMANHNQSLLIAAIISFLCFGGILACHLTEAQKKEIITTTAIVAEAAVEGSPMPWSKIGLAIGTGAVIDNRRKDVLINRLKTENANTQGIITAIATTPSNHSTKAPPLCNN